MILTTNSYYPTSINWLAFITKAVVGQKLNWYTGSPAFEPGPVYVRCVMGKMALGQVFPEYFGFPVSVSFYQAFPRQ